MRTGSWIIHGLEVTLEHKENAGIGPIAADRISQVLRTVLSAQEIGTYYELLYRTEAKVA